MQQDSALVECGVLGAAGGGIDSCDAASAVPGPAVVQVAAGNARGSTDGASDVLARGGFDTLPGTAGADLIAGDVGGCNGGTILASVRAGTGGITRYAYGSGNLAPRGGDGGANNDAAGFGDVIRSGAGNDSLVGDVDVPVRASVRLEVNAGGGGLSGTYAPPAGAAGGSGNRASGFAETLSGGEGKDWIAGDLRQAGGAATIVAAAGTSDQRRLPSDGYGSLFEQAGLGGNGNHVAAFSDRMVGGGGADTIIGDALIEGDTDLRLLAQAGVAAQLPAGRDGPVGGASNSVEAANDSLSGGDGGDLLIGDIYRLRTLGETTLLAAEAGGGVNSRYFRYATDGGDGNLVAAFSDHLRGGDGDDTLAGDAGGRGDLTPLALRALAGQAGEGYSGGNGGADNRVAAFADRLSGGDGSDIIAGDVLRLSSTGPLTLSAAAGCGGSGEYGRFGGMLPGGSGGSDNRVTAFDDTAAGGSGSDRIAGDLAQQLSRGDAVLRVDAGLGAAANAADGGSGGSDNAGFNDHLSGGSGSDAVAGDVCNSAVIGGITLGARGGMGGDGGGAYARGGDGGLDNRVVAFADRLAGGEGSDQLVGDIVQHGGRGDITLFAEVGGGGAGIGAPAGSGGSDNTVILCNDALSGGTGDDTLVGDVARHDVADDGWGLFFRVSSGALGAGETPGGTDNALSAFCDTLIGGAGNDRISGDFHARGVDVRVDGSPGNAIQAFSDSLVGGDGDDTLLGEGAEDAYVVVAIDPGIDGAQALFADTIFGGAGDDLLAGGLGADILSGGSGGDCFRWGEDDLTLGGYGGAFFGIVDSITDFSLADVLDLSAFDLPYDRLRAEDVRLDAAAGDTLLSIRTFDAFREVAVLQDFTTDRTVEALIDDGVILIG